MNINDITITDFKSFNAVRRSGRINMTDIVNGAKLAHISEEKYEFIMWNYDELKEKFII